MVKQIQVSTLLILSLLVLFIPLFAPFADAETQQSAQIAILKAELAVQELQKNNLPLEKAQDLLNEAHEAYAGKNASLLLFEAKVLNTTDPVRAQELFEQATAGGLVGQNYSLAAEKALAVEQRKQETLTLYFALEEVRTAIEAHGIGMEAANLSYTAARQSFFAEHFSDARQQIDTARVAIQKADSRLSQLSRLLVSSKETTTYILQRYWYHLLIALVLLSGCGYVVYNEARIKRAQLVINALLTERKALLSLIERAQEQCFVTKAISEDQYQQKMHQYKAKLVEVAEQLPVKHHQLERFQHRRFWNPFFKVDEVADAEEDRKKVDRLIGHKG